MAGLGFDIRMKDFVPDEELEAIEIGKENYVRALEEVKQYVFDYCQEHKTDNIQLSVLDRWIEQKRSNVSWKKEQR